MLSGYRTWFIAAHPQPPLPATVRSLAGVPRGPWLAFPGKTNPTVGTTSSTALFERREDDRFFVASLTRAVRWGEIEVHAYCLMGTHDHLLLRSPEGKLADAMHRIQLAYSRWFNLSRRRDGSLVRGRYSLKPVRSLNYRRLLARYIDLNPVSARLAKDPSTYEWGSARHYSKPAGPAWLERTWVESEIASECDSARFRPELYGKTLCVRRPLALCQLVEARMAHGDARDPLDDFVSAASPATRRWMIRKAILADGTRPGWPLLSISRLERIIQDVRHEPWVIRRGRSERDGWRVARVGLGRDLCGQTLRVLAEQLILGLARCAAMNLVRQRRLR